jgi:hypothetical protein
MLLRATQEQMIGAALAGLSCSQASRMSGGLGIGQRDALIRRAVIRTTGVWPLLPWRAGQLAKAIHVHQAREIAG